MSTKLTIGIGTRAWGDRLIWDYGKSFTDDDLHKVFLRGLHDDIPYFFTSEAFSDGNSEAILGKFVQAEPNQAIISTKYAPRPWRIRRSDFKNSLKRSIHRLGVQKFDIYQTLPPVGMMKMPMLAECIAEAFDMELIDAIGVSNFTLDQIDQFCEFLVRDGINLSYVETEYNLLNRNIEENGILAFCRKQNITILAQEPLAMGLLSGKYLDSPLPVGIRKTLLKKNYKPGLELLLRTMKVLGSENDGKNCAQIALNWLICNNVVPIPGANTLEQAIENNQAIGWKMRDSHISQLDELSAKFSLRG